MTNKIYDSMNMKQTIADQKIEKSGTPKGNCLFKLYLVQYV